MFGNHIQNKTLQELVVEVKRGLSSYYVKNEGTEVPFINIRDVQDGTINADAVERIWVKETNALEKSLIKANDVIVSIKGSAFKAAVADESISNFVISANLIAFRLGDEVLPEIVVAYLNSPEGQRELQAMSAGAVQKSLNLQSLMSIKIPVPEKQKQKVLAEYFILSKERDNLVKREQEIRRKINNSIMLYPMMG